MVALGDTRPLPPRKSHNPLPARGRSLERPLANARGSVDSIGYRAAIVRSDIYHGLLRAIGASEAATGKHSSRSPY